MVFKCHSTGDNDDVPTNVYPILILHKNDFKLIWLPDPYCESRLFSNLKSSPAVTFSLFHQL